LQIIFSKSFERDYKKLTKNNKQLKEKVDLTIEIFKSNYQDSRLNL